MLGKTPQGLWEGTPLAVLVGEAGHPDRQIAVSSWQRTGVTLEGFLEEMGLELSFKVKLCGE